MTPEALAYCHEVGYQDAGVAVDLGAAGGPARSSWPAMRWHTVAPRSGPGITEMADLTMWRPIAAYDLALCVGALDETDDWPMICETAHFVLDHGGFVVITCAIDPGQLEVVLRAVGFDLVKVTSDDATKETFATARRDT